MIDLKNEKLKSKLNVHPAWRRAVTAMHTALHQNTPHDNSELIELFGKAHFGDLWTPRHLRPDSDRS